MCELNQKVTQSPPRAHRQAPGKASVECFRQKKCPFCFTLYASLFRPEADDGRDSNRASNNKGILVSESDIHGRKLFKFVFKMRRKSHPEAHLQKALYCRNKRKPQELRIQNLKKKRPRQGMPGLPICEWWHEDKGPVCAPP